MSEVFEIVKFEQFELCGGLEKMIEIGRTKSLKSCLDDISHNLARMGSF